MTFGWAVQRRLLGWLRRAARGEMSPVYTRTVYTRTRLSLPAAELADFLEHVGYGQGGAMYPKPHYPRSIL
jgi:hypothetical protein